MVGGRYFSGYHKAKRNTGKDHVKKNNVLILRGVKNDGKPPAVYSGLTPNYIEIANVINCKSP